MDLEPIDPLAPGIVDNGDLAAMPAFTLKGNNTGVSAAPQDIPIDDVLEDIEPYIDIDATLVELAGIIGRAAITGDVTIAAGSNAATIPNGTVTNAKRANMAQSTISGRAAAAGTGAPTDLSVSQVQAIIKDGWATMSWSNSTLITSNGRFEYGGVTTGMNAYHCIPHNSEFLHGRDSGGVERSLVAWGSTSDQFEVGTSAYANILLKSNRFDLRVATTGYLAGVSGALFPLVATMGWDDALSSPLVRQNNRSSGASQAFSVRAQGTTQSSTAGGNLRLQGGRPGSGGTAGEVRIEGNRDDSTFDVAFRAGTSGSAPTLAFYNTAPIVKPTVTGSRGSNAALASLLTALANLGLLTDSSS